MKKKKVLFSSLLAVKILQDYVCISKLDILCTVHVLDDILCTREYDHYYYYYYFCNPRVFNLKRKSNNKALDRGLFSAAVHIRSES